MNAILDDLTARMSEILDIALGDLVDDIAFAELVDICVDDYLARVADVLPTPAA